jgi:dihydroflavonol-4-reductase
MVEIFITGGNGLLGRALVKRLVADGETVVALARSDDAAATLTRLGARAVRGDVLEPSSLERGMHGCATVYNLAGINEFCSLNPQRMHAVNVEGARFVIRAAARGGISRVVHTSSAASIGEPQGTVATEDSPHRGWFLSAYERSKYEGERVVFDEASALGVDVVCVNPSSVQGPGRATGTARLLLAAAGGRLRAVVDTRLSIVDLADCTEGHLLAARHGRRGERYLLNGATLSIDQALDLLAPVTGRRDRPVRLPVPVVFGLAAAVQGISRVRRRRAPLCPDLVRTLAHGHAYDGSRATRDLGLRYTPVEDTLRRTIEWFRREGLLAT